VTTAPTSFAVDRKNDQGLLRSTERKGVTAGFMVRGVEGWRGVAALAIVAGHSWQVMDTDGDGLGPTYDSISAVQTILSLDLVVDLFFVLSGLLLFLPFVLATLDDERDIPSGDDFLWRRVFRFLPTYWVVVLICWSTRNFGVTTADWLDLVEHVLLVQAFDSERIFATIGPAWTLSVDWVFYVALAIFAPPWARWARAASTPSGRVFRLMWPITAIGTASVLYKLNVEFVWEIEYDRWAWRFGPAAKADDFAIGMAAAVLMVCLGRRRIPVLPCALMALAGVWILGAARRTYFYEPETLLESLRHPVGSIGWTLVLVAVMACKSDWPARMIDNAVLLRLSVLAFTVYLVHEPVAVVVRSLGLINHASWGWPLNFAVIGLLSITAAWVLHRVVEEPFVDVGSLRPRGGGRRDLYAPLDLPPLSQAAPPDLPRRTPVLEAAGHTHPMLQKEVRVP
jgi:peptidoglycan/LPS O-acetylase OafA/YrhL